MYSKKFEDFEWKDIKKLKEEVEKQKARVESLQTEHRWIKSSHSAHDLCSAAAPVSNSSGGGGGGGNISSAGNSGGHDNSATGASLASVAAAAAGPTARLDRSDSGIDRQSLLHLMMTSGSGSTCSTTGGMTGNLLYRGANSGVAGRHHLHHGAGHCHCGLTQQHQQQHHRCRSPSVANTIDSGSSSGGVAGGAGSASIRKIIEITSLIRNIEQQLHVVASPSDPITSALGSDDMLRGPPPIGLSSRSLSAHVGRFSVGQPSVLDGGGQCEHCPHQHQHPPIRNSGGSTQQMTTLMLEQERLARHLAQLHRQLYHLESVRIPALLTGLSCDKLKRYIEEYHRLKSLLAELATASSGAMDCHGNSPGGDSSSAMINVVRQLEPIAPTVEEYLKLSQEIKLLQKQITAAGHRKTMLDNNRRLLLQQQMRPQQIQFPGSSSYRARADHLPQSASWDQPTYNCDLLVSPCSELINRSGLRRESHKVTDNSRTVTYPWPDFNGDGVCEDQPPSYAYFINQQHQQPNPPVTNNPSVMTTAASNGSVHHSRQLCHEYVNNEVISATRENASQPQSQYSIEVAVSSFPGEGIVVVQARNLTLLPTVSATSTAGHQPMLLPSRQYRARIQQPQQQHQQQPQQQSNASEGSDWNNVCVSDDGRQSAITPHITLPISWDFKASNNKPLSLVLEIQQIDKASPIHGQTHRGDWQLLFSLVPPSQKLRMRLPLQPILHSNDAATGCHGNSNIPTRNVNPAVGFLSPYSAVFPRPSVVPTEYNDFLKPPDISQPSSIAYYCGSNSNNFYNIRRSQTYSHESQPCCSFDCCCQLVPNEYMYSPGVCVSDKQKQLQQQQLQQKLQQHQCDSSDTGNSVFESLFHASSTNSSFKRHSPFRQQLRMKKPPSLSDFRAHQLEQSLDGLHDDQSIRDLWSLLLDLQVSLTACCSREERMMEFSYFKTKCPVSLLKLYDYFVDTIFNCDGSSDSSIPPR